MINIPQLSKSIATMEGEIVDVNVRLNQVVRQQFFRASSGIVLHSRDLGSYFKIGPSFVGLAWLVIGNSEGKERICS